MKRFLFFIACVFLFIGVSRVAFAQTEPDTTVVSPTKRVVPTSTLEKRKAELEEKKAARVGIVDEKKATIEARISGKRETVLEGRKENISMYFDRITERFNAAVGRLEHIIARFETRIEMLSAQYDVTEAQAHIDQAKEHVANAKSLLVQAETQFQSVLASENPRAIFATVKDLLNQVKDELIAAKTSLHQAVELLKTLHADENAAVPEDRESEPARVTTIAPSVTEGI